MDNYSLLIRNSNLESNVIFKVECREEDLPSVLPQYLPVKDGYGVDIFDYSEDDLKKLPIGDLFNGISYDHESTFYLAKNFKDRLILPKQKFFKGPLCDLQNMLDDIKGVEVVVNQEKFQNRKGRVTSWNVSTFVISFEGKEMELPITQEIMAFYE